MRTATVLYKDEPAGILIQHDNGSFTFKYNTDWLNNKSKPSISLTIPKTETEITSSFLFPFFYNMLPEGANKQSICALNKIDTNDYFSLLIIATQNDSIGAVTLNYLQEV